MNDMDFQLARELGQRIRDEAISLNLAEVAVTDFGKAVGVIFEAVQGAPFAPALGTPKAFAEALRAIAARIDG